MEEATRRELEAAGVAGTVAGQSALLLARGIDDGDRQTASALAALAAQFRETLALALAAGHPRTALDELSERRARHRPRW